MKMSLVGQPVEDKEKSIQLDANVIKCKTFAGVQKVFDSLLLIIGVYGNILSGKTLLICVDNSKFSYYGMIQILFKKSRIYIPSHYIISYLCIKL